MAQSNENLMQSMNQAVNDGGSQPHPRCLGQSTMFPSNCLPPLSPLTHSDSSRASSNSNLNDVSTVEVDVSSRGPPKAPSFQNVFRGGFNHPARPRHRRSNSEDPLGSSAMIQSSNLLDRRSGQGSAGRMAYLREASGNNTLVGMKRGDMDAVSFGKNRAWEFGDVKSDNEAVDEMFNSLMNMDNVNALYSTGVQFVDKDNNGGDTQLGSGENDSIDSSDLPRHAINPAGVKRSATGDIAPPARHYRSLSVDSGMIKYHFGDEYPNMPISANGDNHSPSHSVNDGKLNLDFMNGEFSGQELKKIMADEKLREIAMSDPKRAKRILSNRQSAAQSKERKVRYITELEHKVQTLQAEATTLSAQVTFMQKEFGDLTSQNNELKYRVHAMEHQARLRDALHTALNAEVQRLKLASMDLGDDIKMSNGIGHQISMKYPEEFTRKPNQIHRSSVPSSKTSSASSAPTSA